MLDHLSIVVPDLDRVAAFYDAALGALGYERQWLRDGRLRFGDRLVGDGTFLSVVEGADSLLACRAREREDLGARRPSRATVSRGPRPVTNHAAASPRGALE